MLRTRVLKDSIWVGWLAVVVAIGVAGWIQSALGEETSEVPAEERGVVVEEVGEGSALGKSGLRPEDVVLAWERLPMSPGDQGDQGTIESIFDWMQLEVEQAPRGILKLRSQRNGEVKVFEVEPGEWEVTVRARMPEGLLEEYAKGKGLIEAGKLEAGIDLWRRGAENQAADGRLSCWLWLRIGDAWGEGREWAKAQEAYRFALEAARDLLARVAIWQAIGDAYARASKFEAAREAYRSAQEIRERIWGENLSFAKGLHDLAALDLRQGRLESSQGYWLRALEIRQKLAPGSLTMASSMNNLGLLASARGDLDRAAEYYEQSLAIHRKLAPDGLGMARSINNIGILAYDRGDLDQATKYFEDSLEIHRRLNPVSLDVASSLNNLGALAVARGDLDRGTEYYEESLGIFQELTPGSLEVAASLNNLGVIAIDRDDFDRAAKYYAECLGIRKKLAPASLDYAASLNNLGNLAYARGDMDRAAEYYQESLEVSQKLAPDSLRVAGILNSLGNLARKRGESDRRAEYHEKSLEIRRRWAAGSLDVAMSLFNLGSLAYDHGDLDVATEYYEEALKIERKLAPGSLAEAKILVALADVHRKRNQLQQALSLLLKGLQALENQMTRLGGTRDVQSGFRAERVDFYRDAIDLYLELGQPEQAFHTLERSRARSFLAQLAERDLVFSDIPEELERQRRRIDWSYNEAQDKIAKLHPTEQVEERETLLARLRELRRDSEDITERIVAASPKLGALRYPQPLDLDAARQALDPETVMLSYSVGEDETHLFILTRDNGLNVKTLSLGEKELRREVKDVLKLQERRSTPVLYTGPLRQVGGRLYEALIQPAEESIARSERVLIVPDGPLHLLPFALLVRETGPGEGHEGRDFEFLVEWKPLHSVLSATAYAELKSQRRSQPDEATSALALAAFGDPQYLPNDSEDDILADRSIDVYVRAAVERGFDNRPLPYSREEVSRIAALYPKGAARAFLGAEASEERAKSVGKSARILHFATHGRFDDRIPLNSYVVLTIPKEFRRNQENGLLQAWEIFEDVRLDADLVVLSACESGLGEEIDGEGLKGLTRAFQFAGARTVASSLWQVDDQATAELMVRFYRHLGEGMPKDEALRAAQMELIRRPIEVTDADGQKATMDASAPYYWAAFQIYGDWQ